MRLWKIGFSCLVFALCASTTNASITGKVGFKDSLLCESISGSTSEGGAGNFYSQIYGGTGSYSNSTNSSDVLAGSYSCQSTANVIESGSTAHYSFNKVLPADARFTVDDIEELTFGFKMLTADTNWICQIAFLDENYSVMAKFVQNYRSGNYTTFWGSESYWKYSDWKDSTSFTKISGAGVVTQIRFEMRYVGNASGQANTILVDHMYITISPDNVFSDSVDGGLGEGENGYYEAVLYNGTGTTNKYLYSSDVKAGNYACRGTVTVTNSDGDSHFRLTKVLPYHLRFNMEDLESMSFNFAMMTEDTNWICQIDWLTANNTQVATFVQNYQSGTNSTFWNSSSDCKWDYDDWKNSSAFTLHSSVDEVAKIKFEMRYVGDADGQWNGIMVDDMDIVFSHPYRIGWWDYFNSGSLGHISPMAGKSTGLIICYEKCYADTTVIENWLDTAGAAGLKVIVELPRSYVEGSDTASIQTFVNTFDDHDAVFGWYIYDEPSGMKDECETAYDAIKAVSSKKAFVCFCNKDDIDDYADAYDIALYDSYPESVGDSEFEDHGDLESNLHVAAQNANSVGKPWWFVVQAFGKQSDGTFDARLPTKAEYRHMVYLSQLKGAESVINWSYYRCLGSAAISSQPYPYDGATWFANIPNSVYNEISLCGNAIRAGVQSGISDNQSEVYTRLYRDPFTGNRYIMALNNTGSSKTVIISVWAGTYTTADPIDVGATCTISSGQFTDTLSAYEVIMYELKN